MSRRRIEAGASSAGGFSLRSAPAPPSAPVHVAARVARAAARPPANSQAAALSFRFESLSAKPAANTFEPAQQPARLSNFFSKPIAGSTPQSAEVLRLTAVVDDLGQRLRKTTEAKNAAEGHVQRLTASLTQERTNAKSQVSSLKSEVATAQSDQLKLRGELSKRSQVKEVGGGLWHNRVRSALEQEETKARVADSEARLVELVKRRELLGGEVKILEARRGEAVAEVAGALSAEEVEVLVEKAAAASKQVEALGEQAAALEDGIARFTALRDAHKHEAAEAEGVLQAANERTACAVADEKAASAQCAQARHERDDVAEKLELLQAQLGDLNAAATAPSSFRVSGCCAPPRRDLASTMTIANIDACSSVGVGLPSHFSVDAPIDIAQLAPSAGAEPADKMVTALVSDLQALFTESARSFDAIGHAVAVEQ